MHLPKLSTARVVLAVTALVVVYFLVTAGINAYRSHQLQGEEGRLGAEIQEMQDRYDRLQALRGYLNSDEFIEQVAREQLGLARPGETTFIAIPTAPTATPAPGQAGQQLWWDILSD